ncbi:MAG: peptidoglycan-associated lipoprotein Pal [Methylophilaceae bacterium]
MSKQLWVSALLAMLLAACASKPMVEEPKAAMEDKSPKVAEMAADTSKNMSADTSSAGDSDMSGKTVMLDPRKDPSNILYTRTVFFDYNKDEVKAEYRAMVEAHAKYLVANPEAKLILQGATDDRGSREFNLALGQRRAVAVKNVMNVLGAGDRQIETVSYGEEKQRCAEAAESCWSQNRRADIVYEGE